MNEVQPDTLPGKIPRRKRGVKVERISLALEADLMRKVRQIAVQKNQSVANIVEDIVQGAIPKDSGTLVP